MAACTHEIGTADTGNTPNSSGSFTPAADDLLIVWVTGSASLDNPAAITDSAGLLTFEQFAFQDWDAGASSLYGFVANEPATAVARTIDYAPTDVASGSIIFVTAISGMSKVGTAAIKQFKSRGSSVAADATPDVTFDAACLTTNPTLGFVVNNTNPTGITPPTGWTEDGTTGNLGHAAPTRGGASCFRDNGFTGTNIEWGTSASVWAAIIVELDASAPSGTVIPIFMNQYRQRKR